MISKEDWRKRLEALPMPLEGPSPWETSVSPERLAAESNDPGAARYQLAAELTAKAMLVMADEDPSLLDIPEDITDSWDRSDYSAAWDAAKEHWPGLDAWLGGITGNMFGWANQLVRWIHEKPPVGNPAIITIGDGNL